MENQYQFYSKIFDEYINEIKNEKSFIMISQVKNEFCKALEIEEKFFHKCLKKTKSDYLYDIIGYIDGIKITRFNIIYKFKKIINKIYKQLEKVEKLNFNEKRYVLEFMENYIANLPV